jgi:hypothetical protein
VRGRTLPPTGGAGAKCDQTWVELGPSLMETGSESFDFFFEPEFAFLEFGDHQIVRVRSEQFFVNLFVEFVVLVRQFLDMRLKAHVGSASVARGPN